MLLSVASALRDLPWSFTSQGRNYRQYRRSLRVVRNLLQPAERALREEEQRRAEDRRRQTLAERAQRRDYLLRVSPRKFEEHVGEMFAALGYNVRVTPISSDEGVDAYLEKGGRRAIVQCKRYTKGKVSRPDVQRAVETIVRSEP